MTVINSENKTEATAQLDKPDANIVQQKVDATTSQKQESEPVQKEGEEAAGDPNWRAFREARKKDRAEKEAAERRAIEKEAEVAALKAAMEAAFSKSAPTPQAYQQYYGIQPSYEHNEESEDEKIEKKVNSLLAAREEKARMEAIEREKREYPNRILRDFPDFNNVVSQENLDYIDYHFPELSRPLQRLNEGYDKWSDIYHAIKKLIPNHATAKKDSVRADMNNQKPKSISSTGITQSGEAVQYNFQEVEKRRAENWARMERIRKGIS